MAQKVEWKLPDIVVDIKGNKDIYYENNRNLKRAEIQLAFTEEHREEFNKCANDIHYFAENYYHIRTLDEGIVKIKLRDYQKNMLDSFVGNRNTIVNATRQCVVGSTIVSIFDKQKSRFFDTPIENLFWILQDEDDEFSSNDKNRYAILSDDGYQDFEGILKRDKIDTLDIYLENGKVVSCSKDHVFFNEEYVELEASSLSISDRLVTRHGIVGIKKIENGKRESVYDVCLSSNERYYTNDVLSHNCGKSTSFEIFTCWYILFNEQKSVALLANKAQSSLNILRKVKVAYELLPKWMQSGVVTWNASEIRLENGCHVMAAATSSSGIRSFSMNVCVTGTTKVCVLLDDEGVYYAPIEKIKNMPEYINKFINNTDIRDEFMNIKNDKKYYTVYETTNLINGKIYVGFHSTNDLEDGYLGSGKLIMRAIEKYGPENFTKKIIAVFDNKEEAELLEANIVNEEFVKNPDNYNLSLGGNVCILKGEKHYLFGKTLAEYFGSEKAKEISEKMSIAKKDMILTDDRKTEISAFFTKSWKDASFRAKMINSRIGRKHSEETKVRMSIAQTGRTFTDENRANMSDAQKKRFQNMDPTEREKYLSKMNDPKRTEAISKKLTGRKATWNLSTNQNPEKIKKSADKNRGRIHCHNPEKNERLFCYPYEIPVGWVRGMRKSK